MLTWPLASTAIVVLTVALSLGWYERSKPSPRLVALVATMAALAVVGRIAFAPIPNVKPTTDLVLLAGLAFGAVPGFAVGATTALVSNLFFGQGIHTPWQMLAWGGVGLLGALVGRTLGQRPGRWPIAAVCALAGFAFGAFMDFSLWATVGGQHTLAEYWAISARGLPFNIAHAVGNAGFALAFAPVVLAALARARARAQVTIIPLASGAEPIAPASASAGVAASGGAFFGLLLATVIAACALLGTPGQAQAATKTPIDYLIAHQATNGGFGEAGSADTLASGWAAMALGATPGVPTKIKANAIGYLRASGKGATDPGDLERIILGLRALGATPRDSSGRDLVGALLAQQAADGSFAKLVNQTAFAVLALRSAGRSKTSKPVKRATAFLLSKANTDGGFSYSGRGGSGTDDTAGVVQALIAAGRKGARVTTRATAFLMDRQLRDGGWPLGSEARSNAQSTAWATQALIAAGKSPKGLSVDGNTPLTYLKSLKVSDGHIRYSRTSDQTPVWATAQAQLALVGAPLPVIRARRLGGAIAAVEREANAEKKRAQRAAARERRAKRLARREARRTELAGSFSDQVLAPAAGGVVLLAALFGLE